jgi:hypothetical protein
MSDRQWQIGVAGTFDVENYGDLLFPLIAEAELTERLGSVKLHRFSFHTKTPPEWPYRVTSVTELPRIADGLDGMLIGGGFLIRFDKTVAPGYEPPTSAIHHPTGYWLTPALIALQHGVPVVWNAPGMHCNEIPAWADPLMRLAFTLSSYIAVRDEPSQAALARFTAAGRTAVVPDTGFGLPRLLAGMPSSELARLREAAGLTGPYIVVQAALGLETFSRFVKKHADRFRGFRFLALPIGPVLGDDPAILERDLPGIVRLPSWPHPLLLAELIGQAEAVVGHSYHLAITALTSGVPAFTTQDLSRGKYTALAGFDTIFQLPADRELDPDWFLARLGRAAPSAAVRTTLGRLAEHWDRVAEALRAGRTDTQPALGQFWQELPGLLESFSAGADSLEKDRAVEQERQEHQERMKELSGLLVLARARIAVGDQRIAAFRSSNSWKLTSPLRFFGSRLRGTEIGRNMINWSQITQHKLETQPYHWAVIGELFSPKDAADLAASYPCYHFKSVSGRGGEKDYEYEARSLIGMGAATVSYPEELSHAWRSFANDLLSPEYRSAMSLLIGYDLTDALLEVNVFHFGPGASLGPHPDLPDKIVTHVFYFNESWNKEDGGCLSILSSRDPADIVEEVAPIVGNSAVIVRSDNSWHAVSPVVRESRISRRSVTVTFYRPNSVSSMWPAGDTEPLHRHEEPERKAESGRPVKTGTRWWSRFTSWGQ